MESTNTSKPGTAGARVALNEASGSDSMGGYLAGRLRTKWTGIHSDEVYFRDTAHGFLAWSVALVVTAAFRSHCTYRIVSGAHPEWSLNLAQRAAAKRLLRRFPFPLGWLEARDRSWAGEPRSGNHLLICPAAR